MIIVLIIASSTLAFFIGFKCTKKKEKKVEVDEEAERKYKKMKESFSELMNYDYEQALGSDKR